MMLFVYHLQTYSPKNRAWKIEAEIDADGLSKVLKGTFIG